MSLIRSMEQSPPQHIAATQGKNTNGFSSRSFRAPKQVLLTVTDHAPDVICRFDRKYRLLYVNPAIEKATGIPSVMFLNKTTRELGMPEEHSKDWETGVAYVFSTGAETAIEFPFLTPKGVRHYHSKLVPEVNMHGEVETVLSISRDITDLKEQGKRKEEVVGFVSHEMKTPLTSLKMFAQMLQEKFKTSGDVSTAAHLGTMGKQINKLSNIIEDLTEATRIENNTMKVQRKQFEFHRMVKETIDDVQKTTTLHTIILKGTNGTKIMGDRFRIGQVLTNLLTNAIKYSPESSKIVVTISKTPTTVTCSVKDSGMGIPKTKQKKIFDRFYRVNDSQQKNNLGLGLGLYISSEIIRRHNGKIFVKSKKGKGSTFSFSLPVA